MIEVRKTISGSAPPVPYGKLARATLGERYSLSLVICGDALARKINKKYGKKTYAANVLSFKLSGSEGEIFLNIRNAAREARRYKVSFRARVALLFIHGCLHLKGLSHGATMEETEQKILRRFGVA